MSASTSSTPVARDAAGSAESYQDSQSDADARLQHENKGSRKPRCGSGMMVGSFGVDNLRQGC